MKNIVGTESKDNEFPVFKSDIMSAETAAIPAVSSVYSTAPVSAINVNAPSVDGIAIWRQMSENYRRIRLEKEQAKAMQTNLPPKTQKAVDNSFQNSYEHDSADFKHKEDSFQSDLYKKILQAQMPQLDEPEEPRVEEEKEGEVTSETELLSVADVMTHDVKTIIDSTTIEQVVQIFNKNKIHSLPVVDYLTKNLVGIISSSDVLFHLFDQKAISTFNPGVSFLQQASLAILERPVRDYMNKKVIQVPMHCSVKDACKIMREHNIHRIVVTKNEHVKGIFTSADAVNVLAEL